MMHIHKHGLITVDYLSSHNQDVELFNVSTCFNRKSEFRKPENLNKTISKGEKFNIAELSILKECWGNNYAHVLLTADNLPTDTRQLLEDYGLMG